MLLTKPKTFALDSAHYADLARDLNSSDPARIRRAKSFQDAVATSDYVPLITIHHISELVKHRNKEVVRQSIALLGQLPAAAWIPNYQNPRIAGAITDVLAIEASAALKEQNPTAPEVRSAAAPQMLELGTGDELVSLYRGNWQTLQPILWEREEKSREIMTISNSDIAKQFKLKFSDIKKANLRSQEQAAPVFSAIEKFLLDDIERFGDKKLSNASRTVQVFLENLQEETIRIGPGKKAELEAFLQKQELDWNEILEMKQLEEVGELAVFRKQLKIVSERLGDDWSTLRTKIKPNLIPSWIIQNELRKHRDKSLARAGSELSDRHLACLAAYADITFVDKRTHENMSRARQKSRELSGLIGRVEKVSGYTAALEHLNNA